MRGSNSGLLPYLSILSTLANERLLGCSREMLQIPSHATGRSSAYCRGLPPPPGRAGNGNNLVVIQGNPDSTRISSTVGSGGRDGGATTPPQGLESRLLHVACHVNWHRGPTTSRTASLPFLTQAQVFSELSIFLSPPPGIILPSINTAISIDRNPRV